VDGVIETGCRLLEAHHLPRRPKPRVGAFVLVGAWMSAAMVVFPKALFEVDPVSWTPWTQTVRCPRNRVNFTKGR
jgi:hypothetical protein